MIAGSLGFMDGREQLREDRACGGGSSGSVREDRGTFGWS